MRTRQGVGQEVTAVVRAIKPHYCIASLPSLGHAVAFLPLADYNIQDPAVAAAGAAPAAAAAARGWAAGSDVAARVAALPSSANGVRLGKGKEGGAAAQEEREAIVNGTIVSVGPLGLEVAYGKSKVTAAYLGHIKGLAGRRGKGVEISLRPSALAAAHKGEKVAPALVPSELSPGDRVVGWVQEVGPDALWLSLGPAAKGRVHMFDACDAPRQLAGFQGRFKVGQALAAAVVAVDAKRQKLDLTLRADVAMRPHAAGAPPLPAPGQLLLGRIQAARGSGVLVQLGWHALGLVALTDIHDSWVDNALAGLAEGTFVRARVLDGPPDARGRLRLTLRPSEGGVVEGLARPAAAAGGGKAAGAAAAAAAELGPEQLKEGSQACVSRTDP
ncbi:hypothetical protein MNEG_15437 [Monoraphidium neglectum]|uniref:S1 motif domain-containing protein n=1 Tax=Monoraphidium neglectum TaxID=145388 RepID=A0A0D2LRJ7_9CHLO|nr:hypothetical protein MNEG_15437 [Monoraphidium neglectum]KIY92526.1 hypothetical protein MNEG_15437 [Monoraphidium neglectum]|eukprot:XP_013891546.1 hypothetical protein MNEG_15437 [Monoraphidium neglectum]